MSLTSLASFPALGGYSASKAAAYSVTQALRPELKARRIELLAALPGPIDTDMVKALPMPKTSPADTARGVLAGIARGDEEIVPDPMAQQMGALWNTSHKDFERAFASFGGGSFRAWLYRIATNACLNELERRKRARRLLPDRARARSSSSS